MMCVFVVSGGSPGGSDSKQSACSAGNPGLIPGSGRSHGEGNGNPLQYSCLENSCTEEPGGLQSMGSERVGHDWGTNSGISEAEKEKNCSWSLRHCDGRYFRGFRQKKTSRYSDSFLVLGTSTKILQVWFPAALSWGSKGVDDCWMEFMIIR